MKMKLKNIGGNMGGIGENIGGQYARAVSDVSDQDFSMDIV